MALTIGLVGCAQTKAYSPGPAAQFYTSALFRKAAEYCRRQYDRWFILSARHGLVAPQQVITPYDESLVGKPRTLREAWAIGVVTALRQRGLQRQRFFIHAGRSYADVLTD